ncbi:MAG: homocysteine methyltransferase, partial [Ruminococcaceae bacterium]|nr:homocysteine methyltransferase [Oscillospiraceae bacterium]
MRYIMKITDLLLRERVFFDGGTGTVLQSMGLSAGEAPERWNITHPEKIKALHRAYFEAGCTIVKTNTFGINRAKFEDYAELIRSGIAIAKEAAAEAEGAGLGEKFVAFDMGPTGKLLKPLGELDFEDAVALFAANVKVAAEAGADLILIETMNDAYETKAAVLAAKENSNLPVFVTNVYDGEGKLMTGADPRAMIALLEGLSVDAIGMNCSLGPDRMLDIIDEFAENCSVPIIVNPNAGLPEMVDGKTVFAMDADRFSDFSAELCRRGAAILGGCCGTTPEYIRKVIEKTTDIPYTLPEKKEKTLISSYTHAVEIGGTPILIGERINPTGKKKLKEALRSDDMNYILGEAVRQAEKGVHALDVNVGLPEIDEAEMMVRTVKAVQEVTDLPLQIDTSDPGALECAMRIYNGKPLVNSVNAKEESLSAVLP